MPKSYARFASSPIGAGLAALDDGLSVATTAAAADLARTARGTTAHNTGTRGVEFAVVGEAALLGAVGLVQAGASLSVMVGADAQGIGWRLDTGQVFSGNVLLASGLPAVAKGEIVGIRLRTADNAIDFYKAGTLVHSRALPVAGASWFFAVSLGSANAGELSALVNAGQWLPAGPAALAAWPLPEPPVPTLRVADLDYLAAATDNAPNARYEGIVDAAEFLTQSGLHFWAWGRTAPPGSNVARIGLIDGDGALDGLTQADWSSALVTVRMAAPGGTVAAATTLGRYRCTGLIVERDTRKALTLDSPHDDLDDPLHRVVFPPSIPSLAWNPLPVVIGAVASVPVLPVNNDGSVGWVSDRRVYVETVYDRGDALEPGTWEMDPSGQQILFASPPLGPVTCDCSSIGPGMQPATLHQALADIFARIGKAAWSSADAAAIDAATGYAGIGYYSGSGSPTSVRQALAKILASYGAWWYEGADGVLRFVRLLDPAAVAEGQLAFDIHDSELAVDPVIFPDDAELLTRRMAYRPNAFIHDAGDLVTDLVDLPPARRLELMRETRGQVFSARPLPAQYAHADVQAPFVSCLWREVDAQAEIDRACALYATPRVRYGWRIGASGLTLLPGQVGRIRSERYGLQAGKKVVVAQATRNPATGDLSLVLWG